MRRGAGARMGAMRAAVAAPCPKRLYPLLTWPRDMKVRSIAWLGTRKYGFGLGRRGCLDPTLSWWLADEFGSGEGRQAVVPGCKESQPRTRNKTRRSTRLRTTSQCEAPSREEVVSCPEN